MDKKPHKPAPIKSSEVQKSDPSKGKIAQIGTSEVNDAFLSSIKNTDGSWNLTELSKYVDGIDTLPTLATIEEISYVGGPNTTINLPFTMKISGWWNGENFKMEPTKTIEFTVNNEKVEPVIPPGETTKVSDPFQWWWILVGIGILGIAGGFGTWYYYKHKNDLTKETTEK